MGNVIPFTYQGQAVRFDTSGWINATEAARRFGKEPYEWLRLPDTRRYLAAMAKTGIFPELTRASRGRAGGTWLHPKLAVAFARWLSPEFAVWCDMQIDALLHGAPPSRRQFDHACQALDDGRRQASASGRALARWRRDKPPLEREVGYWRERLQIELALDLS